MSDTWQLGQTKFKGPDVRKGDWMQTSRGKQFWPLDPRPEEVDILDIAGALSKLCRYGGQCLQFYSVAEHCVHVADYAPAKQALMTLLHDASEAYLSDVIRPIKSHLTNYLDIEANLERCIAERFGLSYPWSADVKRLDTAILADERDQAMAPPPVPWPQTTEPPLGVTLQFWTPKRARAEFLLAFRRYGGK
ncbi:phosphohydrolase [Bradyrhizobium liaoningense]